MALHKLRRFVGNITTLVDSNPDERTLLDAGTHALRELSRVDGADIGAVRRATYPSGVAPKPFISGYSNASHPDL
jgi:predicted metal-dependent enzyme (double-stranded beta helix superfamily)